MSGTQKTLQKQPLQKVDRAKKQERVPSSKFRAEQLFEAPETLRPEDVLSAQQQVGNQVVQRSLDGTIQRDGDEELTSLGGGSLNQVYKVTRPKGGPTGYFKPNSEEDPKMGAKSVLSSDIDEVLGLDSLARETYKKYSGKKLGTKKDMKGTESSEVPGAPLYEQEFNTPIDEQTYKESSPNMVKQKEVDGEKKYFKLSSLRYARHDFTNPQTQKDLSNLQMQDSITGQYDRHGGNIRIDDTTGRAKGYDSDKMTSSNITKNSLVNLPGLSKPQNGEPMTDEQKELQKQSRTKALKDINYPFDKNTGLPSHVDQTTAQTMMGMKSDNFIKALKMKNKKNMKRLGKPHIEELRNRYKMVRRYVKAGLGANAPELIQDETKREKWSSPEYQQTVMEGVGMVPKIVDEWGDTSYNEQMNMPLLGSRKKERSYLQRGVLSYNEAQTGKESHLVAEEPEMGPLPTHIPETPWQKSSKTNRRHGLRLDLGQIRGGLPSIGQRSPRKLPSKNTPPVDDQSTEEEKTPPLPLPKSRPLPTLPKNRPLPTPPIQETQKEELNTQPDGNPRRQRITNANGELVPELNDAIQKKRGGGSSLPESAQKEAKKALGREFKDVRIHTDEEAHQLSRAIHARAFTIGKDIFFKQGVFAPGSSAGRETLLHELTHVVQQSGGRSSGPLKLGAPDTAHEKEADQIGKKRAVGASVGAGHSSAVQAQAEEEEIQTQAEEEEIQAQPETSGVVQRDEDHDERVKMRKAMGMEGLKGKELKQVSKVQRTKKSMLDEIKSKSMLPNKGKIKDLEAGRQKKLKSLYMDTKTRAQEKWEGTLSDYKSTKEQRNLAKERLDEFHKGAMNEEDYKTAETKRKSSLEEAAKGGDDEAYKTMKTEREAEKAEQEKKEAGTFKGGFKKAWKEEVSEPVKKFKEGLPGKIGGGLVKGGKSLGKGALKFAGSGFTEGFKHYFGSSKSEDKEKDDEKDEKKGKKGGEEKETEDIKEKFDEVLKENKELKEKLAKLEKE